MSSSRTKTPTTQQKKPGSAFPIILLVAAIFAALIFIGKPLYDDYSLSAEQVDLRVYFGLTEAEDAPVILGDTRASVNAKVFDGVIYWDASDIAKVIDERFYTNQEDGLVLFTTADEVVRANIGDTFYTTHAEILPAEEPSQVDLGHEILRGAGGRLYLSLDFVSRYANFSYEVFDGPDRIQIYAADFDYDAASALKKTALRVNADRKSGMLRSLARGETVYVLKPMGDWTKVRTHDALIGFVETRRLSETSGGSFEIARTYEAPPYTDVVRDAPIVLGWNQLTVYDANAYLADYLEGAYPMNVISPTWYTITDGQGGVNSIASKAYVDQAHARGLEVWPLVDDFTEGLDRHSLLARGESRSAFISFLIGQCDELGLDGINLDFEVVPEDDGAHFTQLLRELSVAMRARGLVFSVDNYPPRAHTEHYNRRVQGEVADYVIIMGYDEHWGSSSGAGSVASLPFVRGAIERTLAQDVPARKTINAVPFYTRIWTTSHKDGSVSATAVGQKTQAEWIAKRELDPIWSEELGQNYTQIDEDNTTRQVWLEDADSMRVRLEMMKSYDLAGVAAWRLGLENAAQWDEIANYINSTH
ncbi:MAG: chitinase [Clostridiales Family XIII bacterium]|jgi:spore germination protein YaaH|nr:chitinase [Clostridiales Family XIII bacterium]